LTKLMKDICILSDSFPPLIDGVASAAMNYAKILNNRGVGVTMAVPKNRKADDSVFNFPVIRYPGIDMTKQIGYVVGNPVAAATLKLFNNTKAELLHSHCPTMSQVLAMELRSTRNIPIVMTYHTKYDIEIKKAIRGRMLSSMAIKGLVDIVSTCDELWVVSKGAGESLRSLGYKGDYIVMENGVDMRKHIAEPSLITSTTSGYDLPQGVPMFLFVGRLQWYKGIRIILDALSDLKARGTDFRMVFVGKGQEEKEIKAYAKKAGLDDRCFFTGAVYDREVLAAWYSRADLFLFPSTFDTNGLVVREAAACSLGSVLVRNSCASEGITDGVDGLLIDENATSLASCLARVIEHPEIMRTIGRNASDNIYISWDDAVERAMARYEVVIDNYKSGKYRRHTLPVESFLAFHAKLFGAR